MLLFLGDSITEWWDKEIFQNDFSKYKIVNLGKAGYTTMDLINILEKGIINTIKPSVIVLMIGTNNLGVLNNNPNVIAYDIKKIIDILLFKFPDTKILLRGLLPRGKFKTNSLRIDKNAVNKIISGFANNTNVTYIDNSSQFLNSNGSIINELMPDNIHLSKKGYQVLSESLTPYIHKMMES